MRRVRLMLALCAASVVLAPMAWGQEAAKPGPEFELLKKMLGTWDMVAKAGPVESKGTATNKLELGGLWLTMEMKAELLGQKFEAKGMATYDATKKKYVMAWADSMSTFLHVHEGTFDEKAKNMTAIGDAPGEDGKPVKLKMVAELKNDDKLVQTVLLVGTDGKEQELVTITYTRRK